MNPIDHYVPITRAKAALLEWVRKTKDDDRTVAITRNGVPEAVIISMDRFDGLMETIEIMADPEAMASIRTSIEQAEKGQWIGGEALWQDD